MVIKSLTKRDIRNKLFGILSMLNGFLEVGHAGGKRQEEMIKYLPHEIANSIMYLQDEIEESHIINDNDFKKQDPHLDYSLCGCEIETQRKGHLPNCLYRH